MVLESIRTDELLTTAAFRGETERVRQMLAHGAVSSARDQLKTTALHWAVSMGHLEVAELLVEHHADLNARAADGCAPLHVAAREGDAELVTFLLDAGANPSLCNSAGSTALDLALSFADEEVDMIHGLRTALRSHEARLLTSRTKAVVQSADESVFASSDVKPVMVSSGCGPDEPLGPDELPGADDLGGGDGGGNGVAPTPPPPSWPTTRPKADDAPPPSWPTTRPKADDAAALPPISAAALTSAAAALGFGSGALPPTASSTFSGGPEPTTRPKADDAPPPSWPTTRPKADDAAALPPISAAALTSAAAALGFGSGALPPTASGTFSGGP